MSRPREVGIVKNSELFRTQINDRWPDYGSVLPVVADTPDGKLFALSGHIYQLQSGTWVALT